MGKYDYQRNGSPILSWKRTPPPQSRAADATSLGAGYEDYPGGQLLNVAGARVGQASGIGSLAGTTLGGNTLAGHSLAGPTISMPLPRAGAPEPLPTLGALGCGCSPVSGITDTVSGLSTPVKIAGAIGLFLVFKKLTKKSRR